MFQKSLRLRLILAFSAMVSLILVVGLVSYATQVEVRDDVRDLGSVGAPDLAKVNLDEVGLEIRGSWHPRGQFVADDIEIITPRRPRLRGVIQQIDQEARTLTMYGTSIAVTAATKNGDDPKIPFPFDTLRVGQRVELACDVESGTWRAREIHTRGMKSSDKIKGMVRAVGEANTRLEMHGIAIVVELGADTSGGASASGALAHIEQATQMVLALQECRRLAHLLVRSATVPEDRSEAEVATATTALANASSSLGRVLGRIDQRGDGRGLVPIEAFRLYLDRMRDKHRQLDEHLKQLSDLALTDPQRSTGYLEQALDPFLAQQFIPSVHAYLSMGGEELGDRLRELVDRTETTTRVAIVASVVAVIVAIILGLLVWRSIQRPIDRLHEAAVKLGKGHLETRVEVSSHDEIGVLAEAFNTMAADLSATTVSMASLENVFDSMAAALIVFDPDGRILNVNHAAETMLGYERGELVGRTFDAICRVDPEADVSLPLDEQLGARIESVERLFVRRDRSLLPVSLSGAGLRAKDGPVQGYVCVAQDLTNQKQVEATIRQSLAEKELLLHEVHHRVKNNMQVISSLLAMQTDDGDPEVMRRLEDSQNRIRTIALIHELLYRSPELARIDIESYLEVLADHLLRSYGAAESVDLIVEIGDVDLDLDQSLAVGLIVNELTTNSLKHAFPAGSHGTIRIGLTADDAGVLTLCVSDDGCGMVEGSASDAKTLGTSLVSTLARQLRGRVEVRHEDGTTTLVVFGGDRNPERIAS